MNQQIGKEPIISVKSSHKQLLLKGILLPNPNKQIRATQNPRRAVALIHPKLESGNCQISPQLSDHLTSLKSNITRLFCKIHRNRKICASQISNKLQKHPEYFFGKNIK